MSENLKISSFENDQLIELCKIYSKNWLAHDGLWFLEIEKKFGIDVAIELDIKAWEQFTVIEAKRIIDFLKLGKNSGLEGLQKALSLRMYANINEDRIVIEDDRTLIYYVTTCRVQEARKKKNLDYFPCKQVGIVEYSLFAKTIDERFTTETISCPPDITDEENYCVWKFRLTQTTL